MRCQITIDREGDRDAQLAGTWIPLLLYADDIVLIAESPEGMQKQLDVVHKFAEDSGLSVNAKAVRCST